MAPAVHALFGYELCGSFSRDPNDPRTGRATLGIAPVTSVERIGRFIDRCSNVRGTVAARRSLEYVADNAWSPAETVVAALVALPVHELGYGLGKVTLNARRAAPPELVKLGAAASRIPDIEVDGLRVGFNYDGHDHLDLPSIARAATQEESDSAIDAVREKYVDDLRRNRELLATGRIVLPVTSEDLFRKNGLDAVMLEAALAEESLFGTKLPELRGTIASSALRRARQRLIWSLLPWDASLRYGREIAERERAAAESLSVEDAYEGSWVKVWTFPEEGGRVVSVDAVDASRNEPPYFSSFPSDSVDGTEKIEDQWDFMMPPCPVHVTVTFGCDGGESCPSAGFSDVGLDAWYHEAVDWVVSNGVMRGYGDGSSFGPDGKITRAEMAQTLWNRAGRPSADLGAVASFADVSADAWYAEPIAWCVEQGIFGGYGDDFGVSRVISREETATVLWRAAGQPSVSGSLGGFVDGGSVSSYAVEPMSWAVSAGVLTGKGGVALDPQGQCTRGEVAAMMMRMAR